MIRRHVRTAATLWRTFGAYGVWQRALFMARSAAGRYRAEPSPLQPSVAGSPVPAAWPMVPDARRLEATTDRAAALERAERVAAGMHQAFRAAWRPLPAEPSDWALNPQTGWRYDPAAPWWTLPHYQAGAGDIKEVWEAARFAWAFDLARAWVLTRDDRWASAFWTRFDSFLAGAPPFRGIQWACGQECAIRAAAWLWAEGAMAEAPSSTPERLGRLRAALAWTAERIDDAHEWGASQRNNHGISDATGLVLISARLLDHDPRAARWMRRGRQLIERYVEDQFAEDGWFIQHSVTYARLAIEQLVQAQRALEFRGTSLPASTIARIRGGAELLAELMDPGTGALPLHGPNDGAYVLPLSLGEYRDFRPALTASSVTFGSRLPAGTSPSLEVLAWLGGGTPTHAPERPVPSVRTGASGWAHVVTEHVRLFARAGAYRSRPGHIDPLHVDIWIAGRPVATDAGSYQYGEPWKNALAGVEVHNTVTVEGRPPAVRGPRFLWLSWPEACLTRASIEGNEVHLEMENRSWRTDGIRHVRQCVVGRAGVRVTDEIVAAAGSTERATVQWLLDGPASLIAVDAGDADVRAAEGGAGGPLGWISERYGEKRPGTSVRITGTPGARPFRVVTEFGDARRSPREREHAQASGTLDPVGS